MAGIVGLLSTSISTTEELLKLERMNCGHKLVHLKITEWQRLFTAACYSGLYEEDEGRSTCPCKTLMTTQQQHPLKLCWTKAKASLQTYRDMLIDQNLPKYNYGMAKAVYSCMLFRVEWGGWRKIANVVAELPSVLLKGHIDRLESSEIQL